MTGVEEFRRRKSYQSRTKSQRPFDFKMDKQRPKIVVSH